MSLRSHRNLPSRLRAYCDLKFSLALTASDRDRLHAYLVFLIDRQAHAPMKGRAIDWRAISEATSISMATIQSIMPTLKPALDAVQRAFPDSSPVAAGVVSKPTRAARPSAPNRTNVRPNRAESDAADRQAKDRRRNEAPGAFASSLAAAMKRHGDNANTLHNAVVQPGETFCATTFNSWLRGDREPQSVQSRAILTRIEKRYDLPNDYLVSKLGHRARAAAGGHPDDHTVSQKRRLAWHLPADFNARSTTEQADILAWVKENIISGGTDYRRYQAAAAKQRFGLRFGLPKGWRSARGKRLAAPKRLSSEMDELLAFKTSPLTAFGYQRSGIWGSETASQKVEHLSLLFGALAADPQDAVRGLGVDKDALSFGHLVFPRVWDWYLRWRYQRRGFYTAWELDMLSVVMSLVRQETGWIRQTPSLGRELLAIDGLVSADELQAAQDDWGKACDRMFEYARSTSKELKRIARVHRDPFEPILVVLEADSPLREYLKITDEILRLLPDERRYPKAAAEAVRSFLMLRVGLHLGVRQKNLRQLLLCPRGSLPRAERTLTDMKCGELRWNSKEGAWEVFIPSDAFKNADSSFFGGKPFRLQLPDVGNLYNHLEAYIDRHRMILLGGAPDPGTLFVKSASTRTRDAAYNQTTFYEAWRQTIQRYGIYNPYTGCGAIEGLLPHGPHNVRDVLATHVLKKTGSYQQASYAIQDTPEMVAKHYGRFLPEDKSAMAARILNEVWMAA